MQAAADARGAADVQIAWLRANMGAYFARKLLAVVRRIERHMGAHDDDPGHQFPRLAGSYLSEVSMCLLCRNIAAIPGAINTSVRGRPGRRKGLHKGDIALLGPHKRRLE